MKKTEVSGETKIFAFLAVFLSIIGFLIAFLTKKKNDYVMFYAKESLVLFIGAIILSIAGGILSLIEVLGFIVPLFSLVIFALWVIQIFYSLSGKKKSTPIIEVFVKKLKL
jgi:uncharacterized membrane protein